MQFLFGLLMRLLLLSIMQLNQRLGLRVIIKLLAHHITIRVATILILPIRILNGICKAGIRMVPVKGTVGQPRALLNRLMMTRSAIALHLL